MVRCLAFFGLLTLGFAGLLSHQGRADTPPKRPDESVEQKRKASEPDFTPDALFKIGMNVGKIRAGMKLCTSLYLTEKGIITVEGMEKIAGTDPNFRSGLSAGNAWFQEATTIAEKEVPTNILNKNDYLSAIYCNVVLQEYGPDAVPFGGLVKSIRDAKLYRPAP